MKAIDLDLHEPHTLPPGEPPGSAPIPGPVVSPESAAWLARFAPADRERIVDAAWRLAHVLKS